MSIIEVKKFLLESFSKSEKYGIMEVESFTVKEKTNEEKRLENIRDCAWRNRACVCGACAFSPSEELCARKPDAQERGFTHFDCARRWE
jgi:hypothetical protein